MAHRPIRVVPAAALQEGFEAIRREAHVPTAFPPEVEAEARAVGAPRTGDRIDVPFVTVDPPGSRDLDQALHIERRGDGHRVRYAIADVAAFVAPGGPLDAETHARGVTVYAPDAKTPLHPLALSEGVASLLPGQWTPAVLWTLDLDGAGDLVATDVARAEVRSVAQHTYADVPAPVAELLAEVGERRLALEIARGGVQLEIPEQEVVREDGSWTVRYRVPLATEDHNAQISLLTGMAAAQLMLRAGHRHPADPAAARRALAGAPAPPGPRARRVVAALDVLSRLRPQPGSHAPRATPRSCTRRRASAAARATPRSTASRPRSPGTSRSPARTPTRPRRCAGCRTATSPSAASPRRRARRSRTGSTPGSPRCPTP